MADDDGPEVLDLGPVDEPAPPASTGPPSRGGPTLSRRAVVTIAGLAVVAGGAALVRSRGSTPPPRPASATPTAPASSSPLPSDARSPTLQPDVVVDSVPGPLLPGQRLDVFGVGPTAVVRVEVATGRVTQTRLPSQSGGGLSFVPVRGGALIHHDDNGTTYLVPDGRGVQEAPLALDGAGPLLPGPDLDHVWVLDISTAPVTLTLVGIDGRRTRTSLRLPAAITPNASPDGAGFPLVTGISGAYRVGPRGLVRVTTGNVLAAGPGGWLVVDCDDRARCGAAQVDRSGHRRVVSGTLAGDDFGPLGFAAGALAPDGTTAALWTGDLSNHLQVVLLDLGTGRRRPTDLTLDANGLQGQALAWTPDGRWLFSVDGSGRIVVVDPVTGRARPLLPTTMVPAVPVVQEIAIRQA